MPSLGPRVDLNASVTGSEACDVVSAARDGDIHGVRARESHSGDDIGNLLAADNHRRMAVNYAIPDPTRDVVVVVA
jgi:hypothetical protein